METTKFNTGTTYTMRFICDADATNDIKILKRTASSVWIKDLHGAATKRFKIYVHDNCEYIFPLGKYSMAPVLKASKAV